MGKNEWARKFEDLNRIWSVFAGARTMPSDIQEQLIQTLMKTFTYNARQARHVFKELMMCVKRRDLVRSSFVSIKSIRSALPRWLDHHFSHGRRIVARHRFGHSQRFAPHDLFVVRRTAEISLGVESTGYRPELHPRRRASVASEIDLNCARGDDERIDLDLRFRNNPLRTLWWKH